MNFLEKIARIKRREVALLKTSKPLDKLREEARVAPSPIDFKGSLDSGISIIAEVKRRSPSKGRFSINTNAGKLSLVYQESGAKAISVLTDRDHFGGSNTDLVNVKKSVGIPILRKDFIIDPVQVYESRSIGADAFLLITALLGEGPLRAMIRLGEELGITPLVEVHSSMELEKALHCGARVVGINNRNLKTFEVAIKTCLDLINKVPEGITAVAESGIRTESDITELACAGFRAFLIGEALVTSRDPGEKLKHLQAAAESEVMEKEHAG
jgi:indole-3-glycerol phosphate synthase